jgi:hypothetical protein
MSEIAKTLARVDGKVYAACSFDERQRYDDYVQALFEHEDEIHDGCASAAEVEQLEAQIRELEDDLEDATVKGFEQAIDRIIAGAERLKESGPKEDETT